MIQHKVVPFVNKKQMTDPDPDTDIFYHTCGDHGTSQEQHRVSEIQYDCWARLWDVWRAFAFGLDPKKFPKFDAFRHKVLFKTGSDKHAPWYRARVEPRDLRGEQWEESNHENPLDFWKGLSHFAEKSVFLCRCMCLSMQRVAQPTLI
jgi:hypothetical protein